MWLFFEGHKTKIKSNSIYSCASVVFIFLSMLGSATLVASCNVNAMHGHLIPGGVFIGITWAKGRSHRTQYFLRCAVLLGGVIER